jgi:hypothetical protein
MGRSLVTLLARCPQPHISFALLVLVLIFHSKASQRHCDSKPFKADGVTAQVLPGFCDCQWDMDRCHVLFHFKTVER